MSSVYRQPFDQFPLSSFLRASGLHVGAAAAAAALRRDLVEGNAVTGPEFDEAYAIARLTPGTNLLAVYVLLGGSTGTSGGDSRRV
jgi:chromate transport protein ChrA